MENEKEAVGLIRDRPQSGPARPLLGVGLWPRRDSDRRVSKNHPRTGTNSRRNPVPKPPGDESLLYGKRNSLAPPAHPGVVLPGQVSGVW